MVDITDLKSVVLRSVWVQVPPRALLIDVIYNRIEIRPSGGTGRHGGLRLRCSEERVGSTPTLGIINRMVMSSKMKVKGVLLEGVLLEALKAHCDFHTMFFYKVDQGKVGVWLSVLTQEGIPITSGYVVESTVYGEGAGMNECSCMFFKDFDGARDMYISWTGDIKNYYNSLSEGA